MKTNILQLIIWLMVGFCLTAAQSPQLVFTHSSQVQITQTTPISKPISPQKKAKVNDEKRKIDIFTIVSLILGLTAGAIGLAAGSIFVYGLVSLIALGFAIAGWVLIRKNPEKYKAEGLAILGVIVGIIGACIGLGIGMRM